MVLHPEYIKLADVPEVSFKYGKTRIMYINQKPERTFDTLEIVPIAITCEGRTHHMTLSCEKAFRGGACLSARLQIWWNEYQIRDHTFYKDKYSCPNGWQAKLLRSDATDYIRNRKYKKITRE